MRRVLRALATLIGLLLALIVIGFGGLYLWFSGAFDSPPAARAGGDEPALEETSPDTLRIALLEADGFDPSAPGAALVLHPLATGFETPVLISDPDALSGAAEHAYFTDYPRRDLGLVVLSVLFLQPPSGRVNDAFATLVMQGREVETRLCNIALCSGPMHDRDLADLPEIGVPVRLVRETVQGRLAAEAREAEIIATPDHVMIRGLSETEGLPGLFDGAVTLQWPSVFGEIGRARETVFDQDMALFQDEVRRFTASLPFSVGLDGWDMQTTTARMEIYRHSTGDRLRSIRVDVRQATPRVDIWVDAEHLDALQNAAAAFDWVTLFPGLTEPEVAEWLADTLWANQVFGAPENYEARLQTRARAEGISLSEMQLSEIRLSYYAPLP